MRISEAFKARYYACDICGQDGYRAEDFYRHRNQCNPRWVWCICCRERFDADLAYFDAGQPKCPAGCDYHDPPPPLQRDDIDREIERRRTQGWRWHRE